MRACMPKRLGADLGEHILKNVHCSIDLRLGCTRGWDEAEDGAFSSDAEDQAVLQATLGDRLAFGCGRLFGPSVSDEFDALQQPPTSDVTDHLERALQGC